MPVTLEIFAAVMLVISVIIWWMIKFLVTLSSLSKENIYSKYEIAIIFLKYFYDYILVVILGTIISFLSIHAVLMPLSYNILDWVYEYYPFDLLLTCLVILFGFFINILVIYINIEILRRKHLRYKELSLRKDVGKQHTFYVIMILIMCGAFSVIPFIHFSEEQSLNHYKDTYVRNKYYFAMVGSILYISTFLNILIISCCEAKLVKKYKETYGDLIKIYKS